MNFASNARKELQIWTEEESAIIVRYSIHKQRSCWTYTCLFIYLFIYFFSVGRYTCERVAGIFWWQWAFSRVFRWSTEVPERSAGIGLHRKWIKLFRFCCFRGEGTNTTQDGGSYLSALKHIFKQVTAGTTINNHSSHQNFHILETFLIYPGIKYEPTLTLWPDFHFSRLTPIFRASTRIRYADHNSSSWHNLWECLHFVDKNLRHLAGIPLAWFDLILFVSRWWDQYSLWIHVFSCANICSQITLRCVTGKRHNQGTPG